MKRICIPALKIALVALVATLIPFTISEGEKEPLAPVSDVPVATSTPSQTDDASWHIPEGLNPHTERVLRDLIKCESRGNENAINPVDRDGTASHGLLQFKPSTLHGVMVEYLHADIEPQEVMNVIYDGDLQIRAWIAWYGDGKPVEWWMQQFPACSAAHNYWL